MNSSPGAPAPPGMGPVTVGALVAGRYRVTARIGAGGMATIYRAVDESLERDVAIKVLHAHLADDESLLARFRAEARAAAGLLHPHIVNVFDQGVADLPYIVMEFVDGPSLREVLLARGRLAPGEALSIIAPVCAALARAHAAGVIHRDIKPENVLIAADGTVKVADFGIARAMADTSHTATGTLVGSVHYLAPELTEGEESSAASDQYSLGVVLFELLTGRKPLPADTPMAVVMRHAKEKIPSVRSFVSDVPPAVDAVLARATSNAPGRRYPDVLAMATALHQAVPGGPRPVVVSTEHDADGTLVIPIDTQDTVSLKRGVAKRRVRRRRPVKAARGHRRRLPLVLLVLALLLAGGGFAVWNWVIAPVTPAPALVGMSERAAERTALDSGITVEVTGRKFSVDAPEGRVLSQIPPPEDPVRRGGIVSVVLSAGPDDIKVPNVTGKPADRAAAQLAQAPRLLEVKREPVFSDTVAKGQVVSQTPKANKTVPQGTVVTLRVSKGIEQVKVPAVAGSSRDKAVAALESAKLLFSETTRYSDDHAEGVVISQSVKPKTTVDKGTTVGLTISKGPLHFTLDDYVGEGLEAARGALAALDLKVRVFEQPRPQIGPFRQGSFGRVEAQVPEAGTRVKRGETINLYTFSEAAEAEDGD